MLARASCIYNTLTSPPKPTHPPAHPPHHPTGRRALRRDRRAQELLGEGRGRAHPHDRLRRRALPQHGRDAPRPQARELPPRVQGQGRGDPLHRLWPLRLLQARAAVLRGPWAGLLSGVLFHYLFIIYYYLLLFVSSIAAAAAIRTRSLQPRSDPPPRRPQRRSSARPTTSRPRSSSAGTAPRRTSGPAVSSSTSSSPGCPPSGATPRTRSSRRSSRASSSSSPTHGPRCAAVGVCVCGQAWIGPGVGAPAS